LKIQYNRNRYYDQYTGRWLTHDPLGITPNPQKPNRFAPIGQYTDGLSLYEYVSSDTTNRSDPWGLHWIPGPSPIPTPPGPVSLRTLACHDYGCPAGFLDPLPSSGRLGNWHWPNALLHFALRSGSDVEFSHESIFAHRVAGELDPTGPGINPSWGPLKDKIRRIATNINLQPCRCTNFSFSGISHEGYLYMGDYDWIGTLHEGKDDEYSTLQHTVRCCLKRQCNDRGYVGELVCRVRFDMKDKYSFDISSWMPMRHLGEPFWHIIHFDKIIDEDIPLP